ncbi:hypothetical protein J4E80_001119 [Alternaria sp. BMP 0032]|nr:hypothetical protein J4E80_001119 [Alternaria sp. BMP 0032]
MSPTYKKVINPHFVRLHSIIEEECKRSPTLAAKFKDYLLIPTERAYGGDEVSVHFRFNLFLPARVCEHRRTLVVRRGPLENLGELELYDHDERDQYDYDDVVRSEGCWLSARDWLKDVYGEHQARQTALEEHYNSTGIAFRFLDLPQDLRYMVYEFVVGKQIWPRAPQELPTRSFDDDDNDEYEYAGSYVEDDDRYYAYHNDWNLDEEYNHLIASARAEKYYDYIHNKWTPDEEYNSLIVSAEMYHDYIHDAALDQLKAAGYDHYKYAALEEFDTDSFYNGLSSGVYPIPFWYYQRKCSNMMYTAAHWVSPENSHVGLGPTRTEQASAMSLLRVSRSVRKEFAYILWGKTIKRFNRINDLDDVVQHLRRYCTQLELPGRVFEPRDPYVLRRVFLSFPNMEYLRFVGYEAKSDGIKKCDFRSRRGGLKWLSDIHTLEHLDLQFQVFKTHHWVEDYEIETWDPWDNYFRKGDVSCQKRFVDMILTLGYELLQRFRKVTISGHVKKSNHKKWDPLLRDTMSSTPRERRDMTAEVAGWLEMRDYDLL